MRALFAILLALPSFAVAQGEAPASERFIVMFEQRSFDLLPLKKAIADRRSAEYVAGVVAECEARATADQAEFDRALRRIGGRVDEHFWIINGCAVDLPPGRLDWLRSYDGVASVWKNGVRRANGSPGPLPIGNATNANNHNADAVHAGGERGAGSTVAILDTGFDVDMNGTGRPHAVFFPSGDPTQTTGGGLGGSRLLAAIPIGSEVPDFEASHGTRVASIAIGGGWNATPQSDEGHAPDASVVGYSMTTYVSLLGSYATELQTIVAAWQRVLADRILYGINVANMSFDGSESVLSPDQQAMDVAADVGDLLVTVSGSSAGHLFQHGGTNFLVAGVSDTDTRSVNPFFDNQTRADGRTYPHLLANGNGIDAPVIDDESQNTLSYGASHSSAQIAGAAALFRSANPTASALEARAALIATAEDVSNVVEESFMGYGYLKDDALVQLANGGGLLQSGSVDRLTPTQAFPMAVAAGQVYSVVASWNREVVTSDDWSDLDLEVFENGVGVASATSRIDSNERLRFRATSTGTVTVVVRAVSVALGQAAQPFAVAGVAAADGVVPGAVRVYGASCSRAPSDPVFPSGLGDQPVRPAGTPTALLNNYGGVSDGALFNGSPQRRQIVYEQGFSVSRILQGIAFRPGGPASTVRRWYEMTIEIGSAATTPSTVSSSFAANRGPSMVRVLDRGRVVFGATAGAQPGFEAEFPFTIPFDQFVTTFPDNGPLLVDITIHASGGAVPSVPVDAVAAPFQATMVGGQSGVATGSVVSTHAPVIAMVVDFDSRVVPALGATGNPDCGRAYTLAATGAPPLQPVAFTIGASATMSGGVPLPLDLGLIGADGCQLWADPMIVATGIADGTGLTTWWLPVPTGSGLIGVTLYHQAWMVDELANPLGVVTTNGLAVTIGGR